MKTERFLIAIAVAILLVGILIVPRRREQQQ